MADKKDKHEESDAARKETVEVPYRGEVRVKITETPPPSRKEKIHRRRPAPPVPEKAPPEKARRRKGD